MRSCVTSTVCFVALLGPAACRQAVGVDEYSFFTECIPGTSTACYPGPPETQGVGACKGGSRVCLADGSGFGLCEGAVAPTLSDDCAMAADTNCDGELPAACSGEPQWARTVAGVEGFAVAALPSPEVEPLVEFAMGSKVQVSNPDGSTTDVVGSLLIAYETDGDVWSSTFVDRVTRSIVAAADDMYTVSLVSSSGADPYGAGTLRITKVQPDTLATAWTLPTQIAATPRTDVGVRAERVAVVATTSDDVDASDFPGVVGAVPGSTLTADGSDVLLVVAAPTGTLAGVALLGGMSDQVACSVDVAPDGSIVVAGCYLQRADFGGDCPLTGTVDLWDGFVARLDAEGTCVEARRVEMAAAGPADCHVQARFDDAGDLHWAAAWTGSSGAKLEAHREGESGWTWSPDVTGGASASARLTVTDLALDGFGHVLLTGGFGGGVGIDGKVDSSMMDDRGWVAKLAHDPAVSQTLWLRAIGVVPAAEDGVLPVSITSDDDGWVYVGGNAKGALDLPSTPPTPDGAAFITRLEP